MPVGRWRAGVAPLVAGGVVAGATLVLALVDPHEGGYPLCPLRALTGWACPACGGLRATHDLATGDIAGAWAMNPLWVVVVPFLVVAALVIVVPGQDTALTIRNTLGSGRRAGVATALGVSCGQALRKVARQSVSVRA